MRVPAITRFLAAYLALLRSVHAERLEAIRSRGAFEATDLLALVRSGATLTP